MSSNGPIIPSDWADLVRGRISCDTEEEELASPLDVDNKPKSCKITSDDKALSSNILRSMPDACHNILRAIHKHDGAVLDAAENDLNLSLDNILSRVPYKHMLEDLFSNECVTGPVVPIITKAYEESYMRGPIDSHERLCVMGAKCECNNLSTTSGFTAVEFLLPCEQPRHTRNMCVICHRMFVQSLFYDIIYSGKPHRGVIQKYGNICGQVGEYARVVMLICPPSGPVECIPFPSVSHQRNRYEIVNKSGIKYITQRGVSFEDFRDPSSMVQ
jgi:hypothetical protein